MSENPVNRERSRHISTRLHFVRDLARDSIIKLKLVKCAGVNNVADALTKRVPGPSPLWRSFQGTCGGRACRSLRCGPG
eukprot:1693023-Rhodomonas_salina.3